MTPFKSLSPITYFNLSCLMICILIHFYSFFGYIPFSFFILIGLTLSLFINAVWLICHSHFEKAQSQHLAYSNWSSTFQSIFIVLFIYAFLQFFIYLKLVGNFRVEKVENAYHLFEKTKFITEVSKLEYDQYWARSSRLFSSYLILFFSFTIYTSVPSK